MEGVEHCDGAQGGDDGDKSLVHYGGVYIIELQKPIYGFYRTH